MHWRAWDKLCQPKSEGGMGFRHLFAFNLAMLAKQGWRLIQNPNSLLGRLLKAIYFPTVNFWEAELGSSPSYAWRSILDGRDILRQGIKRQIGDGMRTNIWYDPWLEGENLLPYHSSRVHVVAELFNGPGMWNIDLLDELFPLHIVQKILALPISTRVYNDRWTWGEDKNGRFTVKSAYHVVRCRVLADNAAVANPSSQLWNKIWTAPVLGKVKICVWKAASNILPTRSRLSERGVDIDTQCSFYVEDVESPIHALRDCVHAASFLQVAQVPYVPSATNVHDWLVHSLSYAPASFNTMLISLWAIWRNRNDQVWNDDAKSAEQLIPSTLAWWEEFKKANLPLKSPRSAPHLKWQPPPLGYIKLNVDDAFNIGDGSTGIGGIFRDHEGVCLGVFSKFSAISSSPTHGEMLALIEGVSLAV